MLIGICGAKCAGKNTVAQYLVEHHNFKKLSITTSAPSEVSSWANDTPSSASTADTDVTLEITNLDQNVTKAQFTDAFKHLDGFESATLALGLGSSEVVGKVRFRSSMSALEAQDKMHRFKLLDKPMRIDFRKPKSDPGADLGAPLTSLDIGSEHSFRSTTSLLDFVTKHWRSRWVTLINSESVLDALSRRPFFILISVDAPLMVRWKRYQSSSVSSLPPPSLESFIAESDSDLYSPTTGVLPLISRAAIRLLNTSPSLAHLYATLGKLDLTNPDRLRPSWDNYFMSLSSLAAHRSNCMKRAVGAVLVSNSRVISTGYNGTPRHLTNCSEGGCPRCNSGDSSGTNLATCLCLHAEENALLEAGRERIREGSVLYCNTCPCLTCSIKIVQVGISEVVYSQGYSMDQDTARVFKSAGVKLRQFSPPANGLIHLEKLEHSRGF